MAKWQKHGKIWQKIAKIKAKNRYQIMGPKDYFTVYKTQHLALTTINTCCVRFLSVKFFHCEALK